jgi:hypothetical protein
MGLNTATRLAASAGTIVSSVLAQAPNSASEPVLADKTLVVWAAPANQHEGNEMFSVANRASAGKSSAPVA